MDRFAKYANFICNLFFTFPCPLFRSCERCLYFISLAALVASATCPDACASATAVLIDFGAAEAQNVFEVPGWNTAILDIYTDYVDIGPGGTTIVVGDNSAYNFQGVTGSYRFFAEGNTVRAYWYNNSSQSISIARVICSKPLACY